MDLGTGPPPGAPLGPPPNGTVPGVQPPDFTYNETEAHFVIVFGAFLTLIAAVSVVVRLYTRYYIANHVGLDDYMAVGALFATIAVNVIQSVYAAVYLPEEGGGTHNDVMATKLFYVQKIIYTIGIAFYKLTFLIQFWRIFRYIYYMRILYITTIVLVTMWSISQILVHIMTCLPLEANWEAYDPNHQGNSNVVCLPQWIPTYFNAGGTVLTDLIVLLLPVPTLWGLKLRRSQKWAAFGVFGIGGIVPIISAGRIWALGTPPPGGFVAQSCFNIAELAAGVITAGLATIRLLISRHFPSRSLATLPSRAARPRSQAGSGGGISQKLGFRIPSTFNSRTDETQLSTRTSEAELFDRTNSYNGIPGRAPGQWQRGNFGNSATVTTGRYDRPMQDGGAEFLKEFGITVEMNWEVTETVAEIR
ncbi:hypothetical protein SCAR479_13682 [Seiridium cardinale]|uniref:Rhodopsin domain-containing protein n=1 Tax=Seiridium cardinale TaxID=138064 RepID=A0ABR2X777_9PEZI